MNAKLLVNASPWYCYRWNEYVVWEAHRWSSERVTLHGKGTLRLERKLKLLVR